MTNPNVHESNQPHLESEHHRRLYQPPSLMRLDDSEINAKGTNVPEANSGLLES